MRRIIWLCLDFREFGEEDFLKKSAEKSTLPERRYGIAIMCLAFHAAKIATFFGLRKKTYFYGSKQ